MKQQKYYGNKKCCTSSDLLFSLFFNIIFDSFQANHSRGRKTFKFASYLATTIQTAVSGCFPGLSVQVYGSSIVAGWAGMSASNLSPL